MNDLLFEDDRIAKCAPFEIGGRFYIDDEGRFGYEDKVL